MILSGAGSRRMPWATAAEMTAVELGGIIDASDDVQPATVNLRPCPFVPA